MLDRINIPSLSRYGTKIIRFIQNALSFFLCIKHCFTNLRSWRLNKLLIKSRLKNSRILVVILFVFLLGYLFRHSLIHADVREKGNAEKTSRSCWETRLCGACLPLSRISGHCPGPWSHTYTYIKLHPLFSAPASSFSSLANIRRIWPLNRLSS